MSHPSNTPGSFACFLLMFCVSSSITIWVIFKIVDWITGRFE